MADAYASAATELKTIVDTEFGGDGWTAAHDKLHPSMGSDGRVAGISPISQRPSQRNNSVKETLILVQIYDYWSKTINPYDQVNPLIISNIADRFERALERWQNTSTKTTDVWYFMVENVDYPEDPTGNKSRIEVTVKVVGDNTALTQR